MNNNKILITGAAGNLGSLLSKHLQNRPLHLLTHKKDVCEELKNCSNIKIFKADLAQKETLYSAMKPINQRFRYNRKSFILWRYNKNEKRFIAKIKIQNF